MDANDRVTDKLTNEMAQRVKSFNRGRTDANGKYVISMATGYRPYYALWRVFKNRPSPLFVRTLALTFEEAVQRAVGLLENCNVMLDMWQNQYFEPFYGASDDIIPIGKYRGKRLAEIYYIDAPYVLWLANKFVPDNKKYERVVELAKLFAVVHFELTVPKKHISSVSRYVGKVGERLKDLSLTVLNVRLQADTYKPDFYVDQNVLAADRDGNRFTFFVKAAGRSLSPNQLSCHSRKLVVQQTIRLSSAKVMSQYEYHGVHYTRLGYVRLASDGLSQ